MNLVNNKISLLGYLFVFPIFILSKNRPAMLPTFAGFFLESQINAVLGQHPYYFSFQFKTNVIGF